MARFYTEGVGVRIQPGFVSDSEDAFFVEAAMSSLVGNEDVYWRRWALWVLYRAGLPAPEDHGERSWTRTEGRSRMTGTYGDTPANRLIRVYERFHTNSAEAWAARIEWRFLTDDAKAGAEVARLIGVLRAASVEAELRPDADKGRAASAQRTKARRLANEEKAKAALARDREWARLLKRHGLPPFGGQGSVKDAVAFLASRYGATDKSVRETLKKRRAIVESPFYAPKKRGAKKGNA